MMIDHLEVHEILRELYPKVIPDDSDESYDASVDVAEQVIWIGDEEVALGEFIHRLLELTPTVTSPLTGKEFHAFVKNGIALAKREALTS